MSQIIKRKQGMTDHRLAKSIIFLALIWIPTSCQRLDRSKTSWVKPTIGNEYDKLFSAIENDDKEEVNRLLSAGANPNMTDSHGVTLLGWATFRCRGSIISALLLKGAKSEADSFGNESPLLLAAATGCAEGIAILSRAGSNPNAKDKQGHPALWNAAYFGHYNCVEALLKHGADVNATNSYGLTALSALDNANGDNPIRDLLLQFGARVDRRGGETE